MERIEILAEEAGEVLERLRRFRKSRENSVGSGKKKIEYYDSEQYYIDLAVAMLLECTELNAPAPSNLCNLFVQILVPPNRFARTRTESDFKEIGAGQLFTGVRSVLNDWRLAEFFGIHVAQLQAFYKAAQYDAANPIATIAELARHSNVDRKTIKAWRLQEPYQMLINKKRKQDDAEQS